MGFNFQNTYKNLPEKFYKIVNPEPAKDSILLFFNNSLAKEIGIPLYSNERNEKFFDYTEYLSGTKMLPGSEPLAQAYAGHQFGHFTILGDGRAHLIGEHITPSGDRFDIQLKGSGRTPYSRGGDGRATVTAMLREYIMSEAMNSLGIPTTRSLAVVLTSLPVYRDEVNHGAVLTRIASSHIRVGTFECAYHLFDEEDLRSLTNYTINRHYPNLVNSESGVLNFFKEVVRRQIFLIVNWMRVGFIHGVMNSDNMSIAGETIDYGPCAFMNSYDPATVYSSIDKHGRYAYANQPVIAQWNLACLANSLLPLIDKDSEIDISKAKETLDWYAEEFDKEYWKMMGEKIGIRKVNDEDKNLIGELKTWMKTYNADYTNTFLAIESFFTKGLSKELEKPEDSAQMNGAIISDDGFNFWETNPDFLSWYEKWKSAILIKGESSKLIIERMQKMNPFTIPRNHLVENTLNSFRKDIIGSDSLKPFIQLWKELENPYQRKKHLTMYQLPPENGDIGYKTFCGT